MYKYKIGMENLFLAMQICGSTTYTGKKWSKKAPIKEKLFGKKKQPNDAYHKRGTICHIERGTNTVLYTCIKRLMNVNSSGCIIRFNLSHNTVHPGQHAPHIMARTVNRDQWLLIVIVIWLKVNQKFAPKARKYFVKLRSVKSWHHFSCHIHP